MKQSTMEAYAEVDSILGLMDTKYIMEIPKQLREMFKITVFLCFFIFGTKLLCIDFSI